MPLRPGYRRALAALLLALAPLVRAEPGAAAELTFVKPFANPQPAGDDRFGAAVAASGKKVLVAAPRAGNVGVVRLFDADPTSPTFATVLRTFNNPTPTASDQFGSAVAFLPDGDVAVGDVGDNVAGENAGAVYVLDGTTGALKRTLLNPTGQADSFGGQIAVIGKNIAVSARFADVRVSDGAPTPVPTPAPSPVPDAGMVHLFNADPASPDYGKLLYTFVNPTPAEGDQFGFAIAAFGSYLLVGAPMDDTGAGNAGAVYLFDADPASPTFKHLVKTFLHPTPSAGAEMGISLAVVGKNLATGGSGDSTHASKAGAVYFFDADPTSQGFGGLLHTFDNPSPAVGDIFGYNVAALGSRVLISAEDDASGTYAGAVFLFEGDPASPSFGDLLDTLPDPTAGPADRFGIGLAVVDGGDVVVGAPFFDVGFCVSGSNQGATCTTASQCPGGACSHVEDAGAAYFFDACGNGITTVAEECDDGNRLDGDCCSSECAFEPAATACTDDGNPCTDDRCDALGTCQHPANQEACDDGEPCTTDDVCTDSTCVGGPAPDCDDHLVCTLDLCAMGEGCKHLPVPGCCTKDVDCDDGNPCTGLETCYVATGTCEPGIAPVCDDGDPCNGSETCNPATGACDPGVAPVCDDGDPCNGSETCDPATGDCKDGGAPTCDDGLVCTHDECVPGAGCRSIPFKGCCTIDAECVDNDVCNGTEICGPDHTCLPGPPLVCDDGNVCNGQESCDPSLGCRPGIPLECDDGNPCNGVETCDTGAGCLPGTPLECDDGNPCNGVETCDAGAGCVPGTPLECDDGNPCNGVETCDAGAGCVPGSLPVEICGQAGDEDCDGKSDCDDDDCRTAPECPRCPSSPTFPSVDCRLEGLAEDVATSPPVSRLQAQLIDKLVKARAQLARADELLSTGHPRHAASVLRRTLGKLTSFRHRLATRAAERLIPAELRAALLASSEPILADTQILLELLLVVPV